MLEKIKEEVYKANMLLVDYGLVTFTWGNVSQIDRESNLVVIKPSGVSYDNLKPSDMVVVDLKGNIVEGDLKPSTDMPTHVYLYKKYSKIGGICHTHSIYATSWAQAGIDIPTNGSTHADNFYGDIPCTRTLSAEEIKEYEFYTGVVIEETLSKRKLDPILMPAVLCNNHGPFTFAANGLKSVEMGKTLEVVAKMTFNSYLINKNNKMSKELIDKHYLRKHGKDAYYGQNKNTK